MWLPMRYHGFSNWGCVLHFLLLQTVCLHVLWWACYVPQFLCCAFACMCVFQDGFLKFSPLLIGADPAPSSGYSCIPLDTFSSYISQCSVAQKTEDRERAGGLMKFMAKD